VKYFSSCTDFQTLKIFPERFSLSFFLIFEQENL